MTTQLNWTERDEHGQITSQAFGIKYRINTCLVKGEGFELYLHLPKEKIITGRKVLWSTELGDVKNYAQSHHDAVCKAVEEALREVDLCVRKHPAFLEMKAALKLHHDWAMDHGEEVAYPSPACELYQKTVNALTL